MEDFERATLTIVLVDTTMVVPLPLRELDALFFSREAFDRFALPHYIRMFGPVVALEIRDSVVAEHFTVRR